MAAEYDEDKKHNDGKDTFRERFAYSFHFALVVYVSTVLVFGTECFKVFFRYYPVI